MIRMIFAVVAGCVVATVIILAFEAVGVAIWPAPKEFVDAAKNW
jgi:hypothetical protein